MTDTATEPSAEYWLFGTLPPEVEGRVPVQIPPSGDLEITVEQPHIPGKIGLVGFDELTYVGPPVEGLEIHGKFVVYGPDSRVHINIAGRGSDRMRQTTVGNLGSEFPADLSSMLGDSSQPVFVLERIEENGEPSAMQVMGFSADNGKPVVVDPYHALRITNFQSYVGDMNLFPPLA